MKPHDDQPFDEHEWTPEERARLDALSTERVPPPMLEQRTMQALRGYGYLGSRPRVSSRFVLGGLLAATAVFAAGALVGYALANRTANPSTPIAATTRAVAQIDTTSNPTTPARHVVWY